MISKYVDNKELKRIIEDGNLKPYKVKNAAKCQGIFLASTSSSVLAQQVYPILWGCHDIANFKDSIDDAGNYVKTALIEFRSNSDEEILETIEEVFNASSINGKKYSFGNLTKIGDTQLSMRLKYPKNRLGTNELLSTQNKYIDIYINKVDKNIAIFDIRQTSSSEMKDINKFLAEVIQTTSDLKINHINLMKLTQENSILFFDSFNRQKFIDWKFITVTKIELKKNIHEDNDEILVEDNEDVADATGNLQGITSAIVSGTSLRTNSFIQDCLKNQFSIATMGYKFENKKDMTKVIIEINFKHDDVKIDISKTFEYDEIDAKEKPYPLLYDNQVEIIKVFQNEAYRIYTNIIKKQNQEKIT